MAKIPAIDIMIMSGPDDGLILKLAEPNQGDSYILGRREDCDVILPYDSQVSRQHTRLFIVDGKWHVQDLGSRNGTYVENQKIHAVAPVEPGQLFRLGRTWLRILRKSEG